MRIVRTLGAMSLAITGLLTMMAAPTIAAPKAKCATIQGGTIIDNAGDPVVAGYDQFGYNYQAHMFNGTYDSVDRNIDGTYFGDIGDYVDDSLIMKWSDAWIANVDCNGDKKLDRGLVEGVASGTSMGWLTNHVNGDYIDGDGNQTSS
ncbi:MAG: hypothetical protein QOF01_55 [Thermomicrobiales bacterium]|nr:hypothetical protein [Thermomicrobiales bacterium]